ncbi:cytochrome P450 [Hysterangium stoloniferum]|nr:cytochrome P450 [Hysterangium stoloniferum]
MAFAQKVLFMAVMRSLYGHHFPPDFYDDLITFDNGLPMIFHGLPFFAPAATHARERLVARFAKYISNSWREDEYGGYLEGASEAISSIVRELKSTDLTLDEISRLMSTFLWGAQSTSVRVAAWAVRYLVTNQEVYGRLQAEIRVARTTTYTDLDSLLSVEPRELDGPSFSLVTSFVKEVMRMTILPVSARIATQHVHIPDVDGESILIREGEIVLANVSSMHYSGDQYQDSEKFIVDRFSSHNKSYGGEEKCFKPFGTGLRVCAGKNFAMHSLRMLVILCVDTFDIRLAPNTSGRIPEIPNFDTRLCTPVADPDKEIDIVVFRQSLPL